MACPGEAPCFYLVDKLQTQLLEVALQLSSAEAKAEYFGIVHGGQRKGRAERLKAWCEKYLTKAEWLKLKSAVRKRRERWAMHDEVKTITISLKAHQLLSRIATRDNVTFSDVLERVLGKAANSAIPS